VAPEDGPSPSGSAEPGSPDPDFDRRLAAFRAQIERAERGGKKPAGENGGARASAASLAGALRLSSEFIAGILGGGGLGWLADHFLGTSPWGLIVLLLLGFVAGVYNVMRDSGFLDADGTPPAG
jgi:ATP synthase protein I